MYIRTKDGIYEVDKNSKGNEDFLWVKTNEANIVQLVWLNCILKQSENLEELCDGFYIDKCKEEFLLDEMFDDCWYDFNLYFKDCAKSGIDVYGFIKTDKGLIYVAKINDKGELELI